MTHFIPDWYGEHSLKGGFRVYRVDYRGAVPTEPLGAFRFGQDPRDWNDQRTWPAPQNFNIPLGDTSYATLNSTYGGFFQDDWTIRKRLTLNLGVRYDLDLGAINSDLESPVEPGKRDNDTNNISPRAGFAYDLRGDGRTILRGGAGRFYDKILLDMTRSERSALLRVSVSADVTNPSLTDPLQGRTFEDFLRLNIPVNLTYFARDYRTPLSDTVSFGIQQQIGNNLAVQADVVRARGKDEQRNGDINLFLNSATGYPLDPTRFGRPNPGYVRINRRESTGASEYDGLELGLTRRMSNRWQGQMSYTLSKTRTNHEGNRGSGVNNPFDPDDEWAYGSHDQRHRFVANGMVQAPWGLSLGGILFAAGGKPINVAAPGDPLRIGSSRLLNDLTTLPRNSERGDKIIKVDLRVGKLVRTKGGVRLEGLFEVFNVFNRANTNVYGTVFGTANYLKALSPSVPESPGGAGDTFFQPRMLQLGFRVSF